MFTNMAAHRSPSLHPQYKHYANHKQLPATCTLQYVQWEKSTRSPSDSMHTTQAMYRLLTGQPGGTMGSGHRRGHRQTSCGHTPQLQYWAPPPLGHTSPSSNPVFVCRCDIKALPKEDSQQDLCRVLSIWSTTKIKFWVLLLLYIVIVCRKCICMYSLCLKTYIPAYI